MKLLLFVSLSGRKMYFHSRSLRTSHCKFRYEIKTSYHGKCLNDFCSLVAMHKKTHSFVFMHRSS